MKGTVLALVGLLAVPACSKAHWTTYTSKDLHFTVETPREPRTSQERVPTEDGYAESDIVVFTDQQRQSGLIAVCVTPMPFAEGHERGMDRMFDDAIHDALRTISGRITHQQSVTVNGVPGREVTATGKAGDDVLGLVRSYADFLPETADDSPDDEDEDAPAEKKVARDKPVGALFRVFYQHATLYQVAAVYPADATAMRDEAARLIRSFKPIPTPKLPTGGGTITGLVVTSQLAYNAALHHTVWPEFTVELDAPLRRHEGIAVHVACQGRSDDKDFIDADTDELSKKDLKKLRSARTLRTHAVVIPDGVLGDPQYCQWSFTLRRGAEDHASLGEFCSDAGNHVTPGPCKW